VVDVVTLLHAAVGGRARVFATVRGLPIVVVEARLAACPYARTGLASDGRVGEERSARLAALAAVVRIGLQVENLVDLAVAVVVAAVTDRHRVVGGRAGVLAAVGGVVVEVVVVEQTLVEEAAARGVAGSGGKREAARVRAVVFAAVGRVVVLVLVAGQAGAE